MVYDKNGTVVDMVSQGIWRQTHSTVYSNVRKQSGLYLRRGHAPQMGPSEAHLATREFPV